MARKPRKPKPADTPFAIQLATADAGMRLAGGRLVEGDVPRQRYTKDIVRAGRYVSPSWEAPESFTPERMDGWIENFRRMQSNGVDVEIVADHESQGRRADKIRGYVQDLYRDGDDLMMVAEMRGEDGIKIAETVKNVSVEIDADFTDGKGNTYAGEALTAVAIVEKPVVPGQQEFRRIAASLKDGEPDTIPVLTLAREDDTMDINGLLKLVGTTIGADDLTVENVEERLKSYVDSQPDPKQLQKLQGQVTELQAKLDAKPDKPKVDEDTLEETAENRESELDQLVGDGKITPAVRDKLAAALIGASGARQTLCLSRTAAKHAGLTQPLAKAVIDALRDNDPVKLAEKTGRQSIKLSRAEEVGDGDEELDPDLKSRGEALYGPAKSA